MVFVYLKRLEIKGFKSFAEPVSIEFHEGITCIVGPNGSGKSNISDAVRWAADVGDTWFGALPADGTGSSALQ